MLGDYIDVNPIEELIKTSGFKTVGDIATAITNPYSLLHGTIINFGSVYPETKAMVELKEFVLMQTNTLGSGETLQTKKMTVLLFNSDIVSLIKGNELVFNSGYDSEDVIGSFNIASTDWVVESDDNCRATVHPNIVLTGNIDSAQLGLNIYGVILAGELIEPPTDFSLSCEIKLKVSGNLND